MHATQLLNTHLQKHCQAIHQKRIVSLMSMVKACIQGKKLSVTGLGRGIKNAVYEKHNIKRADRLIGNKRLHIIITNAGYRTPWFNAVQALGWDFVGRVVGHTMIKLPSKKHWSHLSTIFSMAHIAPTLPRVH